MQDNFSIRDWKNTKLYKEEYEGTKHIVKHSPTNDTFQVWKGDEIITDFATKERAEAEAKRLNNLDSMQEVEDFEADSEDIELEIPGEENNAPVGDKKMQAKASRQDAKIQAYKDITAKMKAALEKFKAAEGDAKEVAKEELKALTPEFQAAKKEYEKLKSVKL